MAKLFSPDAVHITIPEAINESNVTIYVIAVTVGSVEWTVKRRFREFAELHETLLEAGVDKDSLPEKKLLGHRDAKFIMKRRRDLETYLVSVFHFLQHSLPRSLALFLNLNKYDLYHILCDLASEHYEAVSQNVERTEAQMGPLQVHAISERFRSPRPSQDSQDAKFDFANVADYACSLPNLTIVGSEECFGTSNIVPNSLRFDFLAFKNLTKLSLFEIDCSPDKISSLGNLRGTLKYLEVHKSGLVCPRDFLMCDSKHCDEDELDAALSQITVDERLNNSLPAKEWACLEYLDLRQNNIERVDNSVRLAPKLRTVLLGANKIKTVENFSGLPELRILELSDNYLEDSAVENLHTKLGQITCLDLVNNKLTSLKGCEKLYSLQSLNVAGNRIRELEHVFPVSNLPILENLNLQGNPVTTVVDYRLKVFESFGKRCSDLCLDNETPSQSEIDKVSILMALRVAREGKSPTSLFGNLPRPV